MLVRDNTSNEDKDPPSTYAQFATILESMPLWKRYFVFEYLRINLIFEHFDPQKSMKFFFFLSTIDYSFRVQVHSNRYTYLIINTWLGVDLRKDTRKRPYYVLEKC